MTIYSSSIFDGTLYSPVFTDGITRPLNVEVPTIYAVRADRSEVVACHNLASARTIAAGRAPELKDDGASFAYPCKAFVSPTGQYYVEVELKTSQINGSFLLTNVRVDVANRSTALHYVRNGIDTALIGAAFITSFNQ